MSALPFGTCGACGRDEVLMGRCHHCPTCGQHVEMDNCDGEVIDGRTVIFESSSQGFQCERCEEWCHAHCGNERRRLCTPCVREDAVV